MEWIDRLNDAIAYIEEHLTEKIDYEQLGQIACCSSYHFQRMFAYMAGVSLSEYIRMMDTPGVLGVSICNDAEAWRYYIAVSTSQDQGGLEEYIVPAATWAVFSGAGTNQSIQEFERCIVTEWLPTSGYEYRIFLLRIIS